MQREPFISDQSGKRLADTQYEWFQYEENMVWYVGCNQGDILKKFWILG